MLVVTSSRALRLEPAKLRQERRPLS